MLRKFVSFITEAKTYQKFGSRIRIIKARVRGGKIQRRVRKSGIKGYTLRNGVLKRISSQERMHRRMGARRAKVKRRAKMARSLIKRRRSMMIRHVRLGY